MKQVIFLNGPMGVGKSTIGRLLQSALPQAAFIDGDWCMDIDPFVGSSETRAMAADNILHLAGNYGKCASCQNVVVAWLMDRLQVRKALDAGVKALGMEPLWYTLVCTPQALRVRWEQDKACPWRTKGWLEISLRSLEDFAALPGQIDTTDKDAWQVRDKILKTIERLSI